MVQRFDLAIVGGSFAGLACARSAALRGLKVAVLDAKPNGRSVYPVAEMLTARGVPLAFVTGYDRESVDPRFNGVPVLQKPITRESLESYLRDTLGSINSPAGRQSSEDSGRSSALTA